VVRITCQVCGAELDRRGMASHMRVHKADGPEQPTSGRCPVCGALLWDGGMPTDSEFPLTCSGVGCTAQVTFEEAVI